MDKIVFTLGNPQELGTLILYWGLMEEQGYPGAANIKRKMEEQQEQAMQAAAQKTPPGGTDPSSVTPDGATPSPQGEGMGSAPGMMGGMM